MCEGTLPVANGYPQRSKLRTYTASGMTMYISQHPSELALVEDHQRNPNTNNSSDQGKTGIGLDMRIGHRDQQVT